MLKGTLQLISDIGDETDPMTVVDILHRMVAEKIGVCLLGMYRKPSAYLLHRDTFLHPDVQTTDWWHDHQEALRKHGPSITSQMASRNQGPFTFAEALRLAQPTGEDRWIFDLHLKYGRRDGFVSPCGRWTVLFTSSTTLRLGYPERALLFAASQIVASRMEEVIDHRRLKRGDQPSLSPREVAVLQHLSFGRSLVETAKQLTIRPGSVKTHLHRAQTKLGTKHHSHAIAEALRRGLIT